LSRNETADEKISRWKTSFPEQNEKICKKSNESQPQGTPEDMNNFHRHENQNCGENNEDLHQLVKLENFGVITTSPDRRKSEEERSALEQMEKSINKVGSHYEVCLLIESLMLCRKTKPSLIIASDVPKEKY
jgi:hypothetical protein